MRSSSKILIFLVNDLLDYARLRENKLEKISKSFDVRKAIREIVEIQQFIAD